MPTYDYKCITCQHEQEERHSMSADPLIQCTKCLNSPMRRVPNAGLGVQFRGTGFYETDYKGK